MRSIFVMYRLFSFRAEKLSRTKNIPKSNEDELKEKNGRELARCFSDGSKNEEVQ
jgi:hypothetical protein